MMLLGRQPKLLRAIALVVGFAVPRMVAGQITLYNTFGPGLNWQTGQAYGVDGSFSFAFWFSPQQSGFLSQITVPLAEWALAALILATIPTGAFASAAQECAASMARRDRLDHNGFKSRAKRYGLRAENVAYGCTTEECARARWSKSPGHARNMMLPGFQEVASARSRSGRTYWCMAIHE